MGRPAAARGRSVCGAPCALCVVRGGGAVELPYAQAGDDAALAETAATGSLQALDGRPKKRIRGGQERNVDADRGVRVCWWGSDRSPA